MTFSRIFNLNHLHDLYQFDKTYIYISGIVWPKRDHLGEETKDTDTERAAGGATLVSDNYHCRLLNDSSNSIKLPLTGANLAFILELFVSCSTKWVSFSFNRTNQLPGTTWLKIVLYRVIVDHDFFLKWRCTNWILIFVENKTVAIEPKIVLISYKKWTIMSSVCLKSSSLSKTTFSNL